MKRTTTTVDVNKLDKWITLLEDNKVEDLLKELKRLKGVLRPHVKKLTTATKNTSLGNSAEKFKVKLTKDQTEAEKVFKAILKSENIEYEFQKIIYYTDPEDSKEKFFIVDFYLPTTNIIIELDGGYHDKKTQKVKDQVRTKRLKEKGYTKVVRYLNTEVLLNSYSVVVKKLKTSMK